MYFYITLYLLVFIHPKLGGIAYIGVACVCVFVSFYLFVFSFLLLYVSIRFTSLDVLPAPNGDVDDEILLRQKSMEFPHYFIMSIP